MVDERGAGGGSGEGLKELHRSRVFERTRPTPSCSCLPPTACNFLAKALMRGLARDGRSPRTSRREKERKRERERAERASTLSPFSRTLHSLLPFSRLAFVLFSFLLASPPLLPFLPHTPLLPLSLSLIQRQNLHGGGVHEPCAPRGSATVYLNSDLRSDTGLKLAKEVSRCLCIQDTAPPWILRTPFVPKEGTMRATARPAFHRNHHCPSGGGGS